MINIYSNKAAFIEGFENHHKMALVSIFVPKNHLPTEKNH